MTTETEALVGKPAPDVPKIDPDSACNGKRTDHDGNFTGYCDNPAGQGTDHEGTGRCADCGGNNTGPKTEAGKLLASRNSEKHGLTADPFKYHETVDTDEEARFVLKTATAIEERIRENTGSLDFLDEVLARQMAVQFHIVAQASDHYAEEGLFEQIFTPDGQIEVDNRMLDHIRQFSKDLVNNLEKIGATEDSPDVEVNALAMWRSDLE